jgi:hypothetical protein
VFRCAGEVKGEVKGELKGTVKGEDKKSGEKTHVYLTDQKEKREELNRTD